MSALSDSHKKGQQDALRRFKLSNMIQGAAGYNPMLSGQSAAGAAPAPPASATPPAPAAPAAAAGAPKAKALG